MLGLRSLPPGKRQDAMVKEVKDLAQPDFQRSWWQSVGQSTCLFISVTQELTVTISYQPRHREHRNPYLSSILLSPLYSLLWCDGDKRPPPQ